ncbi:MAG: hypothetical protein AAB821_03440 [Patescibacteria group bacterium]
MADRKKPEHLRVIAERGIETIDLVIVNLYDFQGKPEIEQIDIGGPSLLRAAAKNYELVTVVCDPEYYDLVIAEILHYGDTLLETRLAFAAMVFKHTAKYDQEISRWFHKDLDKVHPSHQTRYSDSSVCDLVCENCGAADKVPGGLGRLVYPCPGSR